jgi:hypothetical protein
MLCVLAPCALPYGRLKSNAGAFLHRTDFANVQFQLNQLAVAGLNNAAGQVFITADSDVPTAAANAAAAWNAVQTSAARFAPVGTTDTVNVSGDGNNTIVFLDTPAIRSALGPSLTAVTIPVFHDDGTIVDSDIVFNPVFSFSTTGVPNTFDIQSILTHEMGHALGANHTGIVGAAMFQFTNQNSTDYQSLAPDDVAFASAVYPASAPSPFGVISGTLSQNGAPLRSALVNAIDTGTGTAISALTSAIDGTYSMVTPPGNYVIFAQPLVGNIQPGNLYLTTADAVDINFNTGFLGGNAVPGTVAVTAGNTSNGDFSPPAPGSTTLNLQYFNTGAAGGFADQGRLYGIALPQNIVSGQAIDFVMLGQGIDATLGDANIMLLGPMTLTPGSVRADAYIDSVSLLPYIRMTVTIAAVTAPTPATLVITKNGNISSYTGGLVLMPPPAPAGQ